jgi:ATP-dependent DNA helicase RecG
MKILKEDATLQKPVNEKIRLVFIELSKKKNIWNYIS